MLKKIDEIFSLRLEENGPGSRKLLSCREGDTVTGFVCASNGGICAFSFVKL